MKTTEGHKGKGVLMAATLLLGTFLWGGVFLEETCFLPMQPRCL